jgi:protein gp37
MAENSAISWTDDTFNPWIGCTKVSPACDGCYAENLMATRYGRVQWGAPGQGEGTRQRTSFGEDYPARFVFCASLADVFDNAVPVEWRRDLFDLIRKTPHLTWLLLTKRPGMIGKLFADTLSGINDPAVPLGQSRWPRNAAIGCTVVTQEEADRDIPKLLAAKAALNPAFAFVSMEPLLGPVDLTRIRGDEDEITDVLRGEFWTSRSRTSRIRSSTSTGSSPGARPTKGRIRRGRRIPTGSGPCATSARRRGSPTITSRTASGDIALTVPPSPTMSFASARRLPAACSTP